ncbi:hypothetical protein EYF80_064013 [Liparis tanakae]|uniref:Uncharacterized protein n=1 Tax=Liparis tanakae TaxID=230148 RepID=A0A4Z2EAI7_9TELE|nr:hypothetical protein EYF80_064013 [Liparis tanakae]
MPDRQKVLQLRLRQDLWHQGRAEESGGERRRAEESGGERRRAEESSSSSSSEQSLGLLPPVPAGSRHPAAGGPGRTSGPAGGKGGPGEPEPVVRHGRSKMRACSGPVLGNRTTSVHRDPKYKEVCPYPDPAFTQVTKYLDIPETLLTDFTSGSTYHIEVVEPFKIHSLGSISRR